MKNLLLTGAACATLLTGTAAFADGGTETATRYFHPHNGCEIHFRWDAPRMGIFNWDYTDRAACPGIPEPVEDDDDDDDRPVRDDPNDCRKCEVDMYDDVIATPVDNT